MKKLILTLLIGTLGASINPMIAQQPKEQWDAQWITGPGLSINRFNVITDNTLKEYGVFKFRKTITLKEKPSSFVIHVSADNRYKLFVNEKQVSQGPARGDLYFWNYETIDIASELDEGTNTIAAVVWNDGPYKPEAQISNLTAFILQGETEVEKILNTNNSWKTIKDDSYQPLAVRVQGYYVAGPGELVNMHQHIKDWYKIDCDDRKWVNARVLGTGVLKELAIIATDWMLVPSTLPQMEMTVQRLSSTRKAEGVRVSDKFPAVKTKVTIPANTTAKILLDQEYLTNAYPTLIFSGGLDAQIGMGYSEGLYIHKDEKLDGFRLPLLPKGNRDEVEGKIFIGKTDSIISDGTTNQEYSLLWWRTYRYIQLSVQTKDEPLVIDDIYGTFTGYPFKLKSNLKVDSPEIAKILEIGWRTARLCAFDTYMDCPYYEQLQYIGDARIQAIVSYFNTEDDRLARNALTLMDHSRIAEGITLSRYPTDLNQQIPTFSLLWIAMLHDYYMYRPDSLFIKNKLPGSRQVLSFFEKYQQEDGSLKGVPYWLFSDWAEGKGWKSGMAPIGKNGESALLDLQLLGAYQLASELENQLGLKDFARLYSDRAKQLKNTIHQKYWDSEKNLYADTADKDVFSQHTNTLAILYGVITGDKATTLAKKMLEDSTLVSASIYFKYYLHQALVKAGLGNDYLNWLDKWRENMQLGLTTWAEASNVSMSRSDSHAWGSSPNIEFYRIILGIDSDSPGFSKIKIEPHLGAIKAISGEIPHPNGKVSVKYILNNGKLEATIVIPEKTEGTFIWADKKYLLKEGKNTFKI